MRCAFLFASLFLVAAGCGARAGDGVTGIPDPSIATSLPASGDPMGARAALAGVGVTYGAKYTGEALGNASGGVKRGAAYDGLLSAYADADLEKLWGWKGLALHASGFQIHSTSHFTADNLNSLVTSSNIEAFDSTLLFELWLEQTFFDAKLSVRFGQLAADTEFLGSDTAGLFIANTFGWAVFPSLNLPTGGPIYPLATPGVRLKIEPGDQFAALFAVYNGNPVEPGIDPPRSREKYGLGFRFDDPLLAIGELQWNYGHGAEATGLPGTIKVGGWHHFGTFDDQRFGTDGLSLSDAASNGIPAQVRGNYGIYGVIEQQLYRLPGGAPDKGISAFARVFAGPSEQNPVDLYADAGLVFSGFIPGRGDDVFGVALAYSKVSNRAIDLDNDARGFGLAVPVRNYEAVLELDYQAQLAPGWTLQPMFQYIWHPGGHIENPSRPGTAIGDAAVFGLRTSINY